MHSRAQKQASIAYKYKKQYSHWGLGEKKKNYNTKQHTQTTEPVHTSRWISGDKHCHARTVVGNFTRKLLDIEQHVVSFLHTYFIPGLMLPPFLLRDVRLITSAIAFGFGMSTWAGTAVIKVFAVPTMCQLIQVLLLVIRIAQAIVG